MDTRGVVWVGVGDSGGTRGQYIRRSDELLISVKRLAVRYSLAECCCFENAQARNTTIYYLGTYLVPT